MDKKRQINFNLNNFLLAISIPFDYVEKDICKTSLHHSKRVAYIALKFAQKLNLSPEEVSDLCAYCLIHNSGLYNEASKNKNSFERSEENIKIFPFLSEKNNVLKYQNEHFDGSGVFSLKGDEIPLLSQLIAFADIVDTKFDLSKSDISNRVKTINFIKENENILFSKKLVDYFLDFSSSTNFWIDLQNENDTLQFVYSNLYDFTVALDFEEILEISSVFTSILDKNSTLIGKCFKVLDYYQFEHKDKLTFLIAASLHNIGKLTIPKDIINKPSFLEDIEYEIVKAYPYYTKKVLSSIMGFNDISVWASNIQETIDAKGYPFGLSGKDLSLKDRLMATLNIYESLMSDKNYRKAFSHKEAITLMEEMASLGKLDRAIIYDIDEVFKAE